MLHSLIALVVTIIEMGINGLWGGSSSRCR